MGRRPEFWRSMSWDLLKSPRSLHARSAAGLARPGRHQRLGSHPQRPPSHAAQMFRDLLAMEI